MSTLWKTIWPLLILMCLVFGCTPTVSAQALPPGRVGLLRTCGQSDGVPELPKPTVRALGGYGVLVCEPVPKNQAPGLADFGAGCGRWMQFVVGEHAELGQTPSYFTVRRAVKELGWPHLRPSWVQAKALYGPVGLTHVAVGEISGTLAHCVLTYQLYALPSGEKVGPLITAAGSETQVMAHLPAMERTLLKLLHAAALRVPDHIDLTPGEMGLLGRFPNVPNTPVSPADLAAMQALAQRSPLAALLLLEQSGVSGEAAREAVSRLVNLAPDNFLVLGEEMILGTYFYQPLWQAVQRNLDRFPNNSVLVLCEALKRLQAKNTQGYLALAKHLVECAPHNPETWLGLARGLDNAADAVRQARFYNAMSDEQSGLVERFYAEWKAAALQATRLDPRFGLAWMRLSQAAMFSSDGYTADQAFWRAVPLLPNDADLYWWGTQMYQRKWIGDADKLKKVAELAVKQHYPMGNNFRYVAGSLRSAGFAEMAHTLDAHGLDQLKEDARLHPENADKHRMLGFALSDENEVSAAITEYEAAVRLNADDAAAHVDLGRLYVRTSKFADALPQLQAAVRLMPNDANSHLQLSFCLSRLGQIDQAEREAREAVRLLPTLYSAGYQLAYLLDQRNQTDAAVAAYRQLAQLFPRATTPRIELCRLLTAQKQYPDAVVQGQRAIELDSNQARAHVFLGLALDRNGNAEAGLKEIQEALRLEPKSALIHLSLGKVYLEMGKKPEARTEWEEVLKLEPQGKSADEAQKLLQNNP